MPLIKHSLQYVLARGIPAGINFAALAVYTRMLTPAEYGAYALAIVGVTLGNALFFQWLHVSVIRYWAREQAHSGRFMSTLAFGFAASALPLALLAGLAAGLLADAELVGLVVPVLVLTWIWGFMELNLALRNAQGAPTAYGLLSTARSALSLAIGASLAYVYGGAISPLLGWSLGIALALAFLSTRMWRTVRLADVDRLLLRKLLRYGLPLTASLLLTLVVSTTDRVLLAVLDGPSDAGLYAAGYDLAHQAQTVLMMIVALAAYPLAVRTLEQDGPAAAQHELARYAELLLAIAAPAATGLALLAAPIGQVVLGQSFSGVAVALIPIIAFASMAAGLKAYYFDLAFQLGQRTLEQVWVLLVTAGVNLVLNLVLIPDYGVQGAALATLLSYVAGLLLSAAYGRRYFVLPIPLAGFSKVVAACAAMALVLWPLRAGGGPGQLAAAIFAGATCYLAAALLLDTCGSRSALLRYHNARERS